MFSKLFQFIREVLSKMFPTQNLKQAMGVNTVVSPQMNSALQLWSLMYANQAPWLNEGVTSLGLPVSISSEIARMATIEMKVEISGSPRAEFLCEQLEKLLPKIRQYIEYGNAKGGLIFKPYVINGKIAFDCVQADMFLPVSFDTNGNITHVVFADSRRVGQYWYTRYESHSLVGNVITIRNVAYKSSTQYSLGSQCALSEIADWEGLREESGVKDVIAPLYGYYRYPSANNVDTTSPLGVSCFSRAQDANGGVQLIQQADEIYSSLVWEFVSG